MKLRYLTTLCAGVLLCALAWGCGEKKDATPSEDPSESSKKADEKVDAKGEEGTQKQKEDGPKMASEGTSFSGEVVPEAADGGPAQKMPLELVFVEGGRIRGMLKSSAGELAVSGMLDGDTVRCWVAGVGDGKENVRRGTLLGEKAGDGYEGTLALSDDGASEVVKGSWKVGAEGSK